MSSIQAILAPVLGTVASVAVLALCIWALYAWLLTVITPAPERQQVITEVIHEPIAAPPYELEPAKPAVHRIYLRNTDTLLVPLALPIGLVPYYVTEREPVTIEGRDVTLTAWNPDSLRFERLTYSTSRPRWGYGLDAVATLTNTTGSPASMVVGPGFRLRRDGLHFTGHFGPDLLRGGAGWQVGIRYELTGPE